jgi:D-serine deaminase-like pyridoxal phosphate-dependent protein
MDDVVQLSSLAGSQFRGLHYYDGHVAAFPETQREAMTHQGYDHLLVLARAVETAGLKVEEIITSGTPAMPYGQSYAKFREAGYLHRVSPGTVVYNDTTSLQQLPGYGYAPAVVVLSTVISHPSPTRITCDAGHKSVSADAGVPTCAVIGTPWLTPAKPSEEHLPIDSAPGRTLPDIGSKLYLIPRHVCPTVNNFDEVLMVADGRIVGVERVTARGHESPLVLRSQPVAV